MAISVGMFPAVHLCSVGRDRAYLRCQYVVHIAFRCFIWMMKSLGVLSHDIVGAEKLMQDRGNLIVANHPTLLDVVFIISLLPDTFCVVKRAAWSNPFLAGVMWATGYIQSDDPEQLIADCVRIIDAGHNLLIFPEATRTIPGQPMKLKRGAAAVIVESRRLFTPLIITCKPSTLSKMEKWYEIPCRKMHFKITVGDKINPQPALAEGEGLAKSNRRVNALLRDLFLVGIEKHEQSGRRAEIFAD